MILSNFDKQIFLREYWQKKPCIIKTVIDNFEDPIDEHDLAGLAQEESDSRIINKQDNRWDVHSGPIDDFERACVGQWTLLVQGVDRFIPEVESLSEVIDFIPQWRMDDVMVSYSVKGAGVGAHIDEYDVFIIQGKGSRRWQVGLPNHFTTITPHPRLKQIAAFEAVIDEVLMPGDAVYIPPKHPHNGIALEPCINYSIGFRAPTNVELLTHIVDEDVFSTQTILRFQDKDTTLSESLLTDTSPASRYTVTKNQIDELKTLITALIDNTDTTRAIMRVLSRQQLPTQPIEPTQLLTEQDIVELHNKRVCIIRANGLKPLFMDNDNNNDNHSDNSDNSDFYFFIDGEEFCKPTTLQQRFIELLTAPMFELNPSQLQHGAQHAIWISSIRDLINSGLWFVEQEDY